MISNPLAIILINITAESCFFAMNYILRNKKIPIFKVILVSMLLSILSISLINMTFAIIRYLPNLNLFLVQFQNITINLIAMLLIEPRNKKESVFYTIITYAWWFIFHSFLYGSIVKLVQPLHIHEFILTIIFTILSLLQLFIFKMIAHRFDLGAITRHMYKKMNKSIYLCLLYVLIIIVGSFIELLNPSASSSYSMNQILSAIIYMLIISVIYYYAKNQMTNEQNLLYQTSLLQQQNLYIQSLEDIQKNMREFKHDYQNMMSSLYLYSKQENSGTMEKTLQDMMDTFDENIAKKMNITNQLMNIHILEIKSLFMMKITEIERLQIPFTLEVQYPIKKVTMNTIDLVRILGILLDNAIEETSIHGGSIEVILLSQNQSFNIIVSNTVHDTVDCLQIFKEGYSTKGNNRGLGLSNLETILHKYENCTISTQVIDDRFIQEVHIC